MDTPPALTDGQRANFNTLLRAAKYNDLALISAIRKSDKAPVALLAAVQKNGKEFKVVPLAALIEGDPYELYEDPTTV